VQAKRELMYLLLLFRGVLVEIINTNMLFMLGK